jgi:hypothetical protein
MLVQAPSVDPPRRVRPDLVDRRAGIVNLAPIPDFGARLEPHRRDIRAGDNEMAPDIAHGQGGHRWRCTTRKSPAEAGQKAEGLRTPYCLTDSRHSVLPKFGAP